MLRHAIPLLIACLAAFQPDTARPQQPSLVVQSGHSDSVYALAFSPDGKVLASGSVDNTVKLWDVASGRELRTLVGHSHVVASVAFSPDGRILASGSQDDTIKLWDVATGSEKLTIRGHAGHIHSVAFSPDGRMLASASDDTTVKLWDVTSGREVRTLAGHQREVHCVAFSPRGRKLASGGWDNTVILWDVSHGTRKQTLPGFGFESIAFSPDGKILASGGQDHTIKMWDSASGRELRILNAHTQIVSAIAFNPNGQTLASGGLDKRIILWNVADGRLLQSIPTTEMVASLAFNRDGKTLASGGYQKSITLWDAPSKSIIRTLTEHTKRVNSVAFSPDGRSLAVGLFLVNSVKLWDTAGGGGVRSLDSEGGRLTSVAFSHDGQTLAIGNQNTIGLWDLASGQKVRQLKTPALYPIEEVAFNADDRTLASSGGAVHLWDVASENISWTPDTGSAQVIPMALTADGHTMATAAGTDVKLWDVSNRTKLRTFPGDRRDVWSLAFSPDGQYLAAGNLGDAIDIWELVTGDKLRTLEGQTAESLVFSPDGRLLASGGWDKTVRLWDVFSGEAVWNWNRHVGPVEAIAFTPDGKFIASADEAGMVRLWDVKTKDERATLFSLDGNDWLVTDPAGRFDTNNLDEIQGLSWVFPDEPYHPLSPEVFMRDYYYPKLLARVLHGEELPAIRSLSDLNRAQPQVEVTKIEPETEEGLVSVTVHVSDSQSSPQRDASRQVLHSGAYDLRLFRNGKLVGQWPESTASGSFTRGAASGAERESWRKLHRVELADGQSNHTFNHVRLPLQGGPSKVQFTAYAFNSDGVKSLTSPPYEYTALATSTVATRPVAYLIAMGVNANQSHNLDLELAVSSAERVRSLLRAKLSAKYSEVFEIPLYSELDDAGQIKVKNAGKAELRSVLDLLAGRPVPPSLRGAVDPHGQIRPARPADAVVLYVASHGYADPLGTFYLFPYDTGSNWGITEDVLTRCRTQPDQSKICNQAEDLLAHAISSDDLAAWWRGIDGGEMTMILDSCHSGAVPGKEFRPAPLGDPGFGQLSYDKGMLILSASQPAQTEQGEWVSGGEGRTLLIDALESSAKTTPDHSLEQWLQDAQIQLPIIARQIYPALKMDEVQAPVLLDFARRTRNAGAISQ